MQVNKKTYLLFIIIIVVVGLLFYREARRAGNITVTKEYNPVLAEVTTNIPTSPTDYIYGNPGAPVTVIAFLDFNCSDCQEVYAAITDFVTKNPTKARLVWKSLLNRGWFSGGDSLPHRAAICAGQQDKFWPFVSAIFQSGRRTNEANLAAVAQDLNLDLAAWQTCLASDATVGQMVASSTQSANQLSIESAPTIFINNRRVDLASEVDLADLLQTVAR